MDSASRVQAYYSDARNGTDRPLPPLPDSESDLYSGGDDEENGRANSSQASATVGRGDQERRYFGNQGESSRSVFQATLAEIPPLEHGFSDVKGSGGNSTRGSAELAGDAREQDVNLSRIRSTSNTTQNFHPPSNSTAQPEITSQDPQVDSRVNDMDIPDGNGYNGRVQRIEIMPGTANYHPHLSTALPQYQVTQGLVLPRWQADADVAVCPICHSVFSMFNRKHHCRKCGKVVCAACSPHRITIPREYIVRPPPGVGASPPRASRPLYGSIHNSGEAIIEAGERVRLCNPCVPDPNTAPPEPVAPPPYSTGRQRNERPVGPDDRLPRFSEHIPGQHNNTYGPRPNGTLNPSDFEASESVTNLLRNVQMADNPGMPMGYSVHVSAGPPRAGSVNNAPHSHRNDELPRRRTSPNDAQLSTRPEDRGRFLTFLAEASSTSNETTPPRPFATPPIPTTSVSFPPRAATPNTPFPAPRRPDQATPSPTFERPRRIVPEEHMCPICRGEYPASMLADVTQQERHIEQCIEDQLGRGQPHSPQGSDPVPPPRANTQTRRGMTKYTATARDAVGNEECQICLDNFLPSQELALLTCFCKYHAECILEWWDRHYAKCPTHDHGL